MRNLIIMILGMILGYGFGWLVKITNIPMFFQIAILIIGGLAYATGVQKILDKLKIK